MDDVRVSKYLSRLLRHRPDGLTIDAAGWAPVDEVLAVARRDGVPLTLDRLRRLVAADAKGRYAFDASGLLVRANQGHSIPVRLDHPVAAPPPVLYHGTTTRHLPAIRRDGLLPGRRHAVHLSPDAATATAVGRRHGPPVVLEIDAAAMHADGHVFHHTPNGVWLTASVLPRYLH
ncbi:RNA 2'-phosphotransferase [Actinomadura flavalba]|uniref:RNA 2'-phosphotransferase n=1 Tax=Actinomadura flavalba TaxID=1120938 RepID=UPI00037E6A7D|nr:RNA 2'-phosphotransferase [Actinomadura flavalba]